MAENRHERALSLIGSFGLEVIEADRSGRCVAHAHGSSGQVYRAARTSAGRTALHLCGGPVRARV
jgi:hypothetical protein